MTEPVRERWLGAVESTLAASLAVPQSWGSYTDYAVDRRYKILPNLSQRLRVMVLDDDGSKTPAPGDDPDGNRDGDIADLVAFIVLIQVRGDDVLSPSTWGNRALDTVKRALRAGVDTGPLGAYTGFQPVAFDSELAVLSPDGDGRLVEYLLPCTAKLADNIGGAA